MPRFLPRTFKIISVSLLCYSLLGFLILPGLAQRIADQQLARHALVPATLQRIELNPFSLQLRVHGLQLGETQQPQLAFSRLLLDLQLDSLWRGALHLSEIRLEQLHAEVLFASDGSLNLLQLFARPPSEEPAEPAAEPPAVLIDRLALAGATLHFQDLRPSEPIDFAASSLDIVLNNLDTRPDNDAEMHLSATTRDGGTLDWQGQISLQPLRSSGHLQLRGMQLKPWWPYVRDQLPLVLGSGYLELDADYRLDLSQQTQLNLTDSSLRLFQLALSGPQQAPSASLEALELSGLTLDLQARSLRIGQLRSRGLQASAAREADGVLDWQRLLLPAAAQSAEPAPAATAETAAQPWRIQLLSGLLEDYHLQLADRVPQTPVALQVGPLRLAVDNFDSAAGEQPIAIDLQTGLAPQASLAARGELQLAPLKANLALSSRDIDLRLAQAYLAPFVRLEIRSGLLSNDLQVQFSQAEALALQVSGRSEITQLHTLDTLKQRDFVKWPKMAVEGIDYRHGEHLRIGEVLLEQPYARFVINEDLSTNVGELLIPQPASASETAKAEPARPMAIRIGGIRIRNGSGHFADFSLNPSFATAIQSLDGSIGTLDNRSSRPARVDISGKVDRYAPVSIRGELRPFDPLSRLDIATRFQQVELTTLTPYSGKFAGYRIRKGRLSLDLHYRIHDGQLDAENKLVLEQLQLGEKVDSEDAVDLPVRLAVALLKDSRGTIDIELPVRGNLNDPQFSVMPIIWQTLRNLIARTAQAPFKFIAGLAGAGDADLSQVPFAPGRSRLDEAARSNLDLLGKALQERPELRLEIEGSAALASDGPRLAAQRLEQEFRRTQYRILQRRGDKVPASEEQLQVSESDKDILLEGIYRARLKQQPPAEWRELNKDERHARMRNALLEHWAGSQTLARRLAQRRAARIKQYLVEQGQLASERIYLIDVSLQELPADTPVSSLLHLSSE